jgi:hypothetical protein
MSNILAPDDVANMTALLPIHGDDNGDNNDDGDDALVVDMGDYNDEDVESILRQLMNRSKYFQKVIDIGHERRLTVSYPKTGSENPEDAELLLALNYEPIRDELSQPCIATLNFIMRQILNLLLGFSLEDAIDYLKKRVIIIDRSPYKHRYYADVEADKAGYKALLSLTDELMAKVFTQVLSKEIFPNLDTMVAFGGSACDYFLDLFPELTIQEEHCVHPQVIVNSRTTFEQRRTMVEILTASLSKATGVKPSRQFTPLELDETIFVSAVPTWVRIARSVEGRALNRIFRRDAIIGMKIRILSLAPLDDEVRDRIDTMSHHELGLWIHHHEIAEKQVRLAEAEQAKAKRLAEAEQAKAKRLAEAEQAKAKRLAKRQEATDKFLFRVDELKAHKEKHNHLNIQIAWVNPKWREFDHEFDHFHPYTQSSCLT